VRQFSVTVKIRRRIDNEEWTMIRVYGPQLQGDKIQFMQELRDIRPTAHDRWVMLGDFNLIYRASDKSSGNVNRSLMNQFHRLLEEIEMKELHLHGRRFTWTSGTQAPTQSKIDHVFVTQDWEMLYKHCHLQAARTSMLDHCPMIVTCNPFHRRYKGFR
jgi:exonuclease III